jgi:hypothetical protein
VEPFDPSGGSKDELAVDPPQPAPVVRALEALLAPSRPPVDPWWRAGSDEALDRLT